MLWHDFRVGNMQLLARIVEYIFIHVHYVDAHYIQQPSLLILRYSSSSLCLSPLSPKETRLGHCITNLTQTLVMLFTTKWEPQNCHRFDRFVFFDIPQNGFHFSWPPETCHTVMVSNLLTSKVDPRVRPNGCRAAKYDACTPMVHVQEWGGKQVWKFGHIRHGNHGVQQKLHGNLRWTGGNECEDDPPKF